MVGRKELFNFRQLANQFVIIADDDRNLNVVATMFPHETRDNAMLTYCFVHPERGIVFEVLAMARLSQTGFEDADCRIDVREARADTSFLIEYNSVNGILMEFKPGMDWPLLRDFENKIRLSQSRDMRTSQEIRDMREITKIDKYRHEVFPDDLAVVFMGKLPKPEAIWCKGFLSDDGEMKGRLLNEPWDASLGVHAGDVVEIEVLTLNGRTDLFALLDDFGVTQQQVMDNELSRIKGILEEHPEICIDSVRFDSLIKECNLDERLKDNLLLCIEDDIVEDILNSESYTDTKIEIWVRKLHNDCNMSLEQAHEAVMWWLQILEINENGRQERFKRLVKAKNPFASDEVVEVATKPRDPRLKLDVLSSLDSQLKDLVSDSVSEEDIVAESDYIEVPNVLSDIQSQLASLLGNESVKKQEAEPKIHKETRSFMSLMQLIEKSDFNFPIPIQAKGWPDNKYMEIETIRGDLVYGSVFVDNKNVDMERLPLKSKELYTIYEK